MAFGDATICQALDFHWFCCFQGGQISTKIDMSPGFISFIEVTDD
jgi:hypothetical protein